MTKLHETLDAISKELTSLIKLEEPEVEEMTAQQFFAYAADQITKAKSDEDPQPRLEALARVVELAKAHTWEDSSALSIPLYKGPLSVLAGSRQAELLSAAISVPGPQATPSGEGFATSSAPGGPSTAAVAPAMSAMPPAMPMSTPASVSEGFIAKAQHLFTNAGPEGVALLSSLQAMLAAENAENPGAATAEPAESVLDDGWPSDCASTTFLEAKPEVSPVESFGSDPRGLGRGKTID